MKTKIIVKRTIGIILCILFLPILFGTLISFENTHLFWNGFAAGLLLDVIGLAFLLLLRSILWFFE